MNELLDASRPGTIEADRLQSPAQASLLVNGAIADFDCAHGAFVAAGALMGDELEDAQLAAAVWDFDRRTYNANPAGAYGTNFCNGQIFGVYTPLSTARWSADKILTSLEGWTDQEVPNRQALIATAAVYAGFSLAELGMIMCSAAIDNGPEIAPTQLFTEAEARFTKAIAAATAANRPDLRNAALAGRARVRLYLNNKAGAATDAQAVPAGFVFNATATGAEEPTGRRWNRIFHFVNFNRFHMVEAQSRNLTTGGVPDPRTRVTVTTARALDGRFAVVQNKYVALGSSLPITRYEEAQLILAEAQGGQTAVNVINALRAPHGLPPVSPAEQQNLQQTIIEERRRELWLEGLRLYDINRFQLQLIPATGTTFPKGGQYGPTVCLPLPDVERFNNPNIS
ncbi:MAG: RagB/SusD family nutrient uptake outer membrane protein [Gemmatimonadaceae bacterium]